MSARASEPLVQTFEPFPLRSESTIRVRSRPSGWDKVDPSSERQFSEKTSSIKNTYPEPIQCPPLQTSDLSSVLSELQQEAYEKISSSQTPNELQQRISDLFVKMAEQIPPSDTDAIRYQKIAVDHMNSSDVDRKARLLMSLGDAHFSKKDIDSIQEAIASYESGALLKSDKRARFYLKAGKAILALREEGSEQRALDCFGKGLDATKDQNLVAEFTSSIGASFIQMSERLKNKITTK